MIYSEIYLRIKSVKLFRKFFYKNDFIINVNVKKIDFLEIINTLKKI